MYNQLKQNLVYACPENHDFIFILLTSIKQSLCQYGGRKLPIHGIKAFRTATLLLYPLDLRLLRTSSSGKGLGWRLSKFHVIENEREIKQQHKPTKKVAVIVFVHV